MTTPIQVTFDAHDHWHEAPNTQQAAAPPP